MFLDSATTIWQVGRVVPLPGIGSRTRTGHDFLPTPVRRMFLRHTSDYTPHRRRREPLDCTRTGGDGRAESPATAPGGSAKTPQVSIAAPALSPATS